MQANRRRAPQQHGAPASAPATTGARRTDHLARRRQRSACHCRFPTSGTARPARRAAASDGGHFCRSWCPTGRRRSMRTARPECVRRDTRVAQLQIEQVVPHIKDLPLRVGADAAAGSRRKSRWCTSSVAHSWSVGVDVGTAAPRWLRAMKIVEVTPPAMMIAMPSQPRAECDRRTRRCRSAKPPPPRNTANWRPRAYGRTHRRASSRVVPAWP